MPGCVGGSNDGVSGSGWAVGAVARGAGGCGSGVEVGGSAVGWGRGVDVGVAYFGFIDTKMVRDSFEDPVAESLEKLIPSFFLRRLSAGKAGEAIVNGLEKRAPRIMAPGWWRLLSAMRGLLNPVMDARFERDPNAHDAIRRAEADDPASKRGQLAANPS